VFVYAAIGIPYAMQRLGMNFTEEASSRADVETKWNKGFTPEMCEGQFPRKVVGVLGRNALPRRQ
jgi:hypothetical protein